MISLLQMDIEAGELLFQDDFTDESLLTRWDPIPRGEWTAKNGVLTGCYRGNEGSLIYTRESYSGDVLLDFYARMVPPCDNDLNFTFRANGWNPETKCADVGYIGGLNGWWAKQAGLERYPDCALRSLSGFRAETGREYHIQTGIVGNTCFLAVDGEIVVTMSDPDPIHDPNCGRVGLGVYYSWVEFRKFRLYRAVAHSVAREYTANF